MMDDLIKLDDLLREFYEALFEDFWSNLWTFLTFMAFTVGPLIIFLLFIE